MLKEEIGRDIVRGSGSLLRWRQHSFLDLVDFLIFNQDAGYLQQYRDERDQRKDIKASFGLHLLKQEAGW